MSNAWERRRNRRTAARELACGRHRMIAPRCRACLRKAIARFMAIVSEVARRDTCRAHRLAEAAGETTT